MKKTLEYILVIMSLALSSAFVSCSKYEGPDPQEMTPNTVSGTSWCYSVTDSVSVTDEAGNALKVDCTVSNYLVFQTATHGLITTTITSKGYPKMNQENINPEVFTYTYNKPRGVLTHEAQDIYGHASQEDVSFLVDGRQLRVSWSDGTITYSHQ